MSLMKKLTSALVASSLVLGMVSTAFAAPSADEVNTAWTRLSHYGLAQGIPQSDGTTSPALEAPITRAQLVTMLVRAWGQESNAKLLAGATTGFSDIDGVAGVEWTTGYVFIGNRIAETNGGQKLGTSATTFNPSAELTAIQTLAFTMKFLGLTVPGGDNWVADTIKSAKDAGLITDADEAKYLADPNAAVNRGGAFALLDNLFASYNKLAGGKTVYTTYIDGEAPELTVNKPELTTDKAALTVTGSVKGEYTGVYLGSEKITVNADGTFSVEVPLTVGANTITFTAMDMVGNTAEESFSVTRNAGAPAKIAATMAGEVVAGETIDVTVTVTDANGVALEVAAADITVTAGGEVGTYADGKFTAAEKVATGTLTFSYGDLTPATVDVKVVAGPLAQIIPSAKAVAKGGTITLTPADKFGNAVASGVTYTHEGTGIAITSGGTVYTSAAGSYKVTATSGEATAETTIGVFGAVANLQISAPETIVANGSTRKAVTVTAVDEFGNAIANYEPSASDDVLLESNGVSFYTHASKDDDAEADVDDIDLEFKEGVATAYFAVDTALSGEEIVFTASHLPSGADAETLSAEAVTDAVMPVASALKIASGSAKYFRANTAADIDLLPQVKVAVVDQEGVAVTESYEITATITGPAALENDIADYNGSSSPAVFELNNAKTVGVEGTLALTFTAEGIGSVSHEVKHVIAGNPAKLGVTSDKDSKSADDKIVFTVELQDRNGVPVPAEDDLDVVIKLAQDVTSKISIYDNEGTTAKVWSSKAYTFSADASEGFEVDATTFKFDMSTKDATKFTGDVTANVTVKTGDYGDVTGSKTVSFTPGAFDQIVFDVEEVWAPVAAPTASYVVNLADAKGNTVAKSDVELYVYVSGDDDAVTVNGVKAIEKPYKVKTDANGQVKLDVKARPYVDHDYDIVVVNPDDEEMEDAEALFSVKETVVGSISTKLYKAVTKRVFNEDTDEYEDVIDYIGATSVDAGGTFYVVATVKDNYGGPYDFLDLDGEIQLTAVSDDVLALEYGDVGLDDNGNNFAKTFTFNHVSDYSELATAAKLNVASDSGIYVAELVAGKAGMTSIGAKYTKTQTEISKTSTVQFKHGALADVVVNGGDTIEVDDAGKVYGPFTIALADSYGNTVSANRTYTVKLSSDDPELTFRRTEGGATTSTFTTRGSTSFYFVATAPGTYTVTVEFGYDSDPNSEGIEYEEASEFTIEVDVD